MEEEFSPEEINRIVKAARVWAPGFTQEQLQQLVDSQHRLADSGFCEAAWGVVRLEQEKGIHCTEALDACQQLLQDKAKLEQKVTDFKGTLEVVQGELGQAQRRLEQAREELQAVQAERQKEETDLATLRGKAEKEKRAIQKELEQCRQEADVTKEETATAGQLKAEVGKHGFGLDLVLGLSQEFKGCEDIRDRLAEGLKEGLTLTEYNSQAEERRQSLDTDVKSLEGERRQVVSNLSQLRADTAFEEELRRFYHRYQSAGWFMEQLASWRGIFFVRCGNPLYAATRLLDQSTRGAHFWTEKPPGGGRCPCCDYPLVFYDEELYQALNLPIGESYKLQLGE